MDAIQVQIGQKCHILRPEIGLAIEPQTAFFSYSRDDSAFALRLAKDLKAAGARVWLDQLDITPGQRWARAIQESLSNCRGLMVIMSPSSVISTNVEDEVAFALEERKTVIPVLYRDCKIPFQLRSLQYVDFRTNYDLGLETLLRTMGVQPQPVVSGDVTSSAFPTDTGGKVSATDESKRNTNKKPERSLIEKRTQPFRSAKMIIGLAVGVVVFLLLWILWPRGADKQHLQPQTKAQSEQSTEQQPQGARPQPEPPTADPRKPVAKGCPAGVYCDPDTNLMWTIKDNGKDITQNKAEQYCRSLTLAGYSDWELPTIEELEKLYDPQAPNNAIGIRKPLRLTEIYAWSSTKNGSGEAWNFGFNSGGRWIQPKDASQWCRALCLRRTRNITQ